MTSGNPQVRGVTLESGRRHRVTPGADNVVPARTEKEWHRMRDAQAEAALEAVIESGCGIISLDANIEQLLQFAAHLANSVDRMWETLGPDEKLVWLKIAHHTVLRCFSSSDTDTIVPHQQSSVRARISARS